MGRRHAIAGEKAQNNVSLPTGKRYSLILADPPWHYSGQSPYRSPPSDHYPTMSVEEISSLPVKELAADDAVLFLWTTVPKLEDGWRVMSAWGFAYKSHMV